MNNNDEYHIPSQNMPALRGKIDALNRRATKLGCEPLRLEQTGTHRQVLPDGRIRISVTIRLTGTPPILAGWQFIAALDRIGDANIIRAIPGGPPIPAEYRTRDLTCEHCRKAIPSRKWYYLLLNETGDYKVVGSTCLGSFLPGPSADAIAAGAECLLSAYEVGEAAEKEGWAGCGGSHLTHTEGFLAAVACAIETWGWRSSASAAGSGGPTTARDARDIADQRAWTRQGTRPTITDAHRAEAAATHSWIRALAERASRNDYQHNLLTAANRDDFDDRYSGIIASAVAVRRRELEQEANRGAAGYLGHPGEHFETVATVTTQTTLASGQWGPTTLVKMRAVGGQALTWFSSRNPGTEQGKTYKVEGTIKAHKKFRGQQETIVTRCVIGGC